MPPGAVGIVIAAVLAAAMSTLSSSLNTSAGAFLADFYRPFRPDKSEGHFLFVSKLMTLVWGTGQMAVALVTWWLGSPRSIINQVLTVAGLTTGLILGLFLMGSLAKPVRPRAALVGLALGFIAVLMVWLPSTWKEEPPVAWPWYAPIGTLVTVGVAWFVNRLDWGHGSSANRSAQPGLDQPG
jgi:Na+/proline symporter